MKSISLFALATVCAASLTFTACSKDTPQSNGGGQATAPNMPAEQAPALTDLKLEFPARARLPKESKDVVAAIRDDKPVKFETITSLILARHHAALGIERNKHPLAEIEQKLVELSSSLDSSDPNELKKAYEARLEKSLNTSIQYNADANNVFNVLTEGRLQCYSGTVLNQLVTRRLESSNAFKAKHHVVLFEAGHILPGYLIEKNGAWHLYGVETTTAGRSIVYYGTTAALDIPIRVIDAEYFALLDLFRDDATNIKAAAAEAVAKTAKRYDIDVERLEKRISASTRDGRARDGGRRGRKLNESPLAFGEIEVTAGDQARATSDIDPRTNLQNFIEPKELLAPPPAPPSDSNGSSVIESHSTFFMNLMGRPSAYLSTGNMRPNERENLRPEYNSSPYRYPYPTDFVMEQTCGMRVVHGGDTLYITLAIQDISPSGIPGVSIKFERSGQPKEARICKVYDEKQICQSGYKLTFAPDYTCTIGEF